MFLASSSLFRSSHRPSVFEHLLGILLTCPAHCEHCDLNLAYSDRDGSLYIPHISLLHLIRQLSFSFIGSSILRNIFHSKMSKQLGRFSVKIHISHPQLRSNRTHSDKPDFHNLLSLINA